MNYLKTALVVLVLQFSVSLYAAEFCVTNSVELRLSLSAAENNQEHDIIKLAVGNYPTGGSSFRYEEYLGWDIDISGGWTEFHGNPCGLQHGTDPYGTVLDGTNESSRILYLLASNQAEVNISHLSFVNGLLPNNGRGGAIYFDRDVADFSGKLTIEYNVFIANEAPRGAAITIDASGRLNLKNNLFYSNHSQDYTVELVYRNAEDLVYVTNNTVVNNSSDTGGPAGIYLNLLGGSALVANNILWDNGLHDLVMGSGQNLYLKHNNIGQFAGVSALESIGNISLPPRFEFGTLNFTPAEVSPLVNAGVKPCFFCPIPVPFDENWSLGATDLAGNLRTYSSKVDIGAFESSHDRDLIFWGTFD